MVDTDWTSPSAWQGSRQPIESALTLPAAVYTDHAFASVEQRTVFGAGWVGVGLSAELDADGAVLVRAVAGRSVIVTRNPDGELRGFYNSCRHRGTELVAADCELGALIRCPYHRWAYDLDGRLVATPRFDELDIHDFDPATHSLHPVRVDECIGVLFVSLDADVVPVATWLGDLPDRMAGYNIGAWSLVDQLEVPIDANWKLLTENFQEYYHLPWIHPTLAKVSRVDDHYRFQGPGMYCGQCTTPVSGSERDDWLTLPPAAGLNESDAASGRFIAMFPNVLLSVLPNHAFVILLEPHGPGRTVERCAWLVPGDAGAVDADAMAKTKAFWIEVNGEDIDICERAQRGIGRGGFDVGRLSPRFEEPLHRFHNMLADRMTGVSRVPDGDPDDAVARYGTGTNPLPYSRGS